MKTSKVVATAFFTASQFLAASALAGGGQDQQTPAAVPEVLVVKVPKDKVQQKEQKGSQLVPIQLEQIPRNAKGEVLWNEVAQRVHEREQSAKAIPLKRNNLDNHQVPEKVQNKFDAVQGSNPPAWYWWYYYYPYRYGGYYGYSSYPYYGYNYPSYGYYYNNYLYPYSYSNYSYPYGNYYYNYWYRW